MKGVLHADFERRGEARATTKREQGRKFGERGGTCSCCGWKDLGRACGELLTSLSSHKPSGKPRLSIEAFGAGMLFLWDAATHGFWAQGCQGRACTALGGPLIHRRHDKPVKSREGSSEGVREASVLGIQMKTSCLCSSLSQDKHGSMQPERGRLVGRMASGHRQLPSPRG